MPEARLDLRHVGILMRSHAKYAVRGGSGLTFALIVIFLGLTVAGFLVRPVEDQFQDYEKKHGVSMDRNQAIATSVDLIAKPALGWWLGTDKTDPHVLYLLDDRPGLLSAMFLILLCFEPFMMAFGGFNQLSGDIASRGLRYLLLRTSRLNIVLSRILGTLVFSAALSFFTVAVVVAYIALRYDLYATSDLLLWGLYGWGALTLFSLPYLSLCTWISTSVGSPFGALALAQMAIGVPIIAIKYANSILDVDWLDRLTPWGWKFDLLHPDFAKVGVAALVMLGFFALFSALAMRHFLRRDL